MEQYRPHVSRGAPAGIKVPFDAVADASGGSVDDVPGEVGIAGRGLKPRVSYEFVDHRQLLTVRQRT